MFTTYVKPRTSGQYRAILSEMARLTPRPKLPSRRGHQAPFRLPLLRPCRCCAQAASGSRLSGEPGRTQGWRPVHFLTVELGGVGGGFVPLQYLFCEVC